LRRFLSIALRSEWLSQILSSCKGSRATNTKIAHC